MEKTGLKRNTDKYYTRIEIADKCLQYISKNIMQ